MPAPPNPPVPPARRPLIRRFGVWARRSVYMVALMLFASVAIMFGVIAVIEIFGAGKGDELAFLPAIASPICALLAWACWWLLVDDLRQ